MIDKYGRGFRRQSSLYVSGIVEPFVQLHSSVINIRIAVSILLIRYLFI